MTKIPLILAIDTSCDDTSAAVTKGTEVLSNIIASQTDLHKKYGGVFPTIAKQAHKENIKPVIDAALKRAGVSIELIDYVAVTTGPGLAPALEVGIESAKKIGKPIICVNHIEGHLLSVLAHGKLKKNQNLRKINFPVLSIIISGGHSQFVYFNKIGEYQILGQTLDDAAGECLDKIGRMLNLGYPAGPTIEKFAKLGNANKYKFPLPLTQNKDFNLSFSGMKTHARNLIVKLEAENPITSNQIYDLCASAQEGVFRHIVYKLEKLLKNYPVGEIWLGGGVSANISLRKAIKNITNKKILFLKPYSKKLCMDNAAMIGVAAYFSQKTADPQNIDRLPRWSLTDI